MDDLNELYCDFERGQRQVKLQGPLSEIWGHFADKFPKGEFSVTQSPTKLLIEAHAPAFSGELRPRIEVQHLASGDFSFSDIAGDDRSMGSPVSASAVVKALGAFNGKYSR